MTNPISKAIIKAAVAMGYGKKSDYKGSSVADVLEKFASIAKDKGGSDSGRLIVGATLDGSTFTFDKTAREIINAMKTVGATFVYGSEGAGLVADFNAVNITSRGIINFLVYSFQPTAQTLDDYPTASVG